MQYVSITKFLTQVLTISADLIFLLIALNVTSFPSFGSWVFKKKPHNRLGIEFQIFALQKWDFQIPIITNIAVEVCVLNYLLLLGMG